jgi:membrane associated rhomboid family serine protease
LVFVLYPNSRVLTLVVVFPVKIAASVFLGLCFLYQLVEANYGLFSASAKTVAAWAFFAHIGGSCLGVRRARAFVASRETARSRSESLSVG